MDVELWIRVCRVRCQNNIWNDWEWDECFYITIEPLSSDQTISSIRSVCLPVCLSVCACVWVSFVTFIAIVSYIGLYYYSICLMAVCVFRSHRSKIQVVGAISQLPSTKHRLRILFQRSLHLIVVVDFFFDFIVAIFSFYSH